MTNILATVTSSTSSASPKRQKKQSKIGPYNLLQTLGEGEFGKVKLGIHVETGQEVAIKLIKKEGIGSDSRINKVEREISVLKTLNHPYIVKLYNVIETEKYIGIILEYASGGELFEYILAHRYLKEKDAKKFFAQLTSSVQYMHKRNVVHRDLKLENLLLDKNRNIVVTDFGFANQFSSEDDLMATTCGSPCYAAPELVVNAGLYAGSAVDIWSCGVILYAMLCGFLPFDDDPTNPDSDNINQLYRYILSTSLVFPSHVGSEAKDLLEKMLVPDPSRRCTLEYIIKHPWLKEYRELLKKDTALDNARH
ncbi:MAG: kinase-like domain-containing protein [Benjaminiella poitrasii]|nr:MAG: kinase-like domain-containing protein [Benjaminiella poitrasii]